MKTPERSVRHTAREEGIDLNTLMDILRLRRPDQSETEQNFVEQFLDPIEGMRVDEYGNRYIIVGDTNTLWSCHTDTVSKAGGNQNIQWDGDILGLHEGKPGMSLGADDGAGLWLLLELIKAGKPGVYVFHRAEEVGGKGSSFIAKNYQDFLKQFDRAIAFDRRGTSSVITRQGGTRTCSDAFALALAAEFNKTEGLKYELDDGGTFTDTANYDELIPECTNISVGYYKEHGPTETLDVAHLLRLRKAVLDTDFEALPVERDPSVVDNEWDYFGYGGWGRQATVYYDRRDKMEELIERRIGTLALWFETRGWTADDLNQALNDFMDERDEINATATAESFLFCEYCQDHYELSEIFETKPTDGSQCPMCFGHQTWIEEFEFA